MIVEVVKVKPVLWPHWLAAFEVFMLSIMVGLVSGWTSPYLAKLTEANEVLTVTEEEASWIAAAMNLGRIGGAVTGALMVDYLGSKVAVHYTGLPNAIGWLLILIPGSIWFIYLARIFGGFSTGMFFSTFPLYMGEISSPKIRGTLISFITQGMPLGVLLGNVIGAYTPMWLFSSISLVFSVIFLLLFATMPESPHYLIRQNRMEKAKKSLEWYNRNIDVTPELDSLREFVCQRKSITYGEKLGQLLSMDNRKAVLVVSIVFTLVQLSGLWTISFYMEIILTKAGVTMIEPSLVVIIIGVLGIIFGWASTYANDKCGRKIMLAISCFGVTSSFFLLGLNYQLLQLNYRSHFLTQWLPIISIVLFQCSLCVGIVTVPSTLMSEMFSPDVKSTATCLANLSSSIFAFLTTKTYQTLIDLTAEQYVFWFYGLLNGFLAIYTILCIPETKGKSLQQIQKMLRHEKEPTPVDTKFST